MRGRGGDGGWGDGDRKGEWGGLVGVGMTLANAAAVTEGCCYVQDIKPDGAVFRSRSVQEEDMLVRVDSFQCRGASRDVIKSHVLGPPGSTVRLVFVRPGVPGEITVELTRCVEHPEAAELARAREPMGERFDPGRGDGARHQSSDNVRGCEWEGQGGRVRDDRGRGAGVPRDMNMARGGGADARFPGGGGRGRGGGGGGGGGTEERRGGGSGRESSGAVGFRGAGQTNARQLTSTIKNCRGLGELARILQEQRGALDHIHVSAAWVGLARIGAGRGGGDVGEAVLALQDRTRDVLGEAGGREVANMIHSMAKHHQKKERNDQGLLEAMQRRATATAGEFKPQGIANVLWALATMGERTDRGLLEAMQKRATATAGEFKPQESADLLWGLATMGEKADQGLLEAMQTRATATAGEFKPQDVANLLWSLATMGEKVCRGLLEAMQTRVTATAGEFNPQHVANVLWALAVMGEATGESLVALIDLLAARVLEIRDQLNPEVRSQLHQWLLVCELDLVPGTSLSSAVALVKQEAGGEFLQAFSGQATGESQLQKDVAAALKEAVSKSEIQKQFRDPRSGHSIDILVRQQKAAGSTEWEEWFVEVDGPTRFLSDGRTPSGSTLLKRKQLVQLGYTVVAVPFWEWEALTDDEAKKQYLADKLKRG